MRRIYARTFAYICTYTCTNQMLYIVCLRGKYAWNFRPRSLRLFVFARRVYWCNSHSCAVAWSTFSHTISYRNRVSFLPVYVLYGHDRGLTDLVCIVHPTNHRIPNLKLQRGPRFTMCSTYIEHFFLLYICLVRCSPISVCQAYIQKAHTSTTTHTHTHLIYVYLYVGCMMVVLCLYLNNSG